MTTTKKQSPEQASFFATARKAFVAGGAAAGSAGGTSIALAFSDGQFSGGDIWIVLGAIVGGFAVGFAGVYRVPNAASDAE